MGILVGVPRQRTRTYLAPRVPADTGKYHQTIFEPGLDFTRVRSLKHSGDVGASGGGGSGAAKRLLLLPPAARRDESWLVGVDASLAPAAPRLVGALDGRAGLAHHPVALRRRRQRRRRRRMRMRMRARAWAWRSAVPDRRHGTVAAGLNPGEVNAPDDPEEPRLAPERAPVVLANPIVDCALSRQQHAGIPNGVTNQHVHRETATSPRYPTPPTRTARRGQRGIAGTTKFSHTSLINN